MWRSEWKQVWVGPAKADMAAKVFESIGKFGLALAVAGGMVNSALCNMDAGHWAVIFDGFGGVQDIVIEEGTHFLIPWVQKPIISDCRSRPCNVPVNTGSKDLQNVIITLRILLLPVAGQLPRILPSTGENYDECAARPPLHGFSSPWWLGWRTDHPERAGLQSFTSGHISKRTESRVLKRYVYTHVHSSTTYNRQKMETTCVHWQINR